LGHVVLCNVSRDGKVKVLYSGCVCKDGHVSVLAWSAWQQHHSYLAVGTGGGRFGVLHVTFTNNRVSVSTWAELMADDGIPVLAAAWSSQLTIAWNKGTSVHAAVLSDNSHHLVAPCVLGTIMPASGLEWLTSGQLLMTSMDGQVIVLDCDTALTVNIATTTSFAKHIKQACKFSQDAEDEEDGQINSQQHTLRLHGLAASCNGLYMGLLYWYVDMSEKDWCRFGFPDQLAHYRTGQSDACQFHLLPCQDHRVALDMLELRAFGTVSTQRHDLVEAWVEDVTPRMVLWDVLEILAPVYTNDGHADWNALRQLLERRLAHVQSTLEHVPRTTLHTLVTLYYTILGRTKSDTIRTWLQACMDWPRVEQLLLLLHVVDVLTSLEHDNLSLHHALHMYSVLHPLFPHVHYEPTSLTILALSVGTCFACDQPLQPPQGMSLLSATCTSGHTWRKTPHEC
jgi:hypothetical protein